MDTQATLIGLAERVARLEAEIRRYREMQARALPCGHTLNPDYPCPGSLVADAAAWVLPVEEEPRTEDHP